MNVCILMGSPRKNGNTAALLQPFCEELQTHGAVAEVIWLHDKTILPCTACRVCQNTPDELFCAQKDDLPEIARKILACDLLVLATPIYSWYCTAPMKAALDRLVYCMNKFYGMTEKHTLWKGLPVALLLTCGYRPEKGCDLFEEGMRRYCKHSGLRYLGSHAERHLGYGIPFMDTEKDLRVRNYARVLLEQV